MDSPFDDLDRVVSAVFSEAAILSPRSSSQYAERTADPNRLERTVNGVFSAGPGESPIKGQSVGGEFQGSTRIGSMKAEFWLGPEQIAGLGFMPQRGDKVTFPGRCGSPVYSVAGLQHTNRGDIALILVREDQSE